MITGTQLQEWGMQPGPIFKTTLKILNHPSVTIGKAKAEELIRGMLADSSKYVGHAILGPVVKEMQAMEKKEKATRLSDKGCPVSVYGMGMIEIGAMNQIHLASKLPISIRAALMPDAHEGYGLPIGGVLAVDNAVIPYAVGVDIGCRMQMSVFDVRGRDVAGTQGKLAKVLEEQTIFGKGIKNQKKEDHPVLLDRRFDIPSLKRLNLRFLAQDQLGTSGAGNHFVEFGILDMDGEKRLAVLSHSGSRGVGFQIAKHYVDVAIKKCHVQSDARNLSWFSLDDLDGQEYWQAMELAGDFAKACHDIIHEKIRKALGVKMMMRIENHHNFAWVEQHDGRTVIVHRKGATPAGVGVRGLIPGSMTTETYVVEGKGNEDSICSSSHGAGRLMSRSAAKQKFTMAQVRENLKMAGVTLIGGSVDECSMSYKDIHMVMKEQKDLVGIMGVFKPIVVRMAGEGEEDGKE